MPWPMPRDAPVTSAEGGAAPALPPRATRRRHDARRDASPWPTIDRAIAR